MPITDITNARSQRINDKRLDMADAKAILDAAGKSVSADELKEIEKSLTPKAGEYVVDPQASSYLRKEIRTIKSLQAEAKTINEQVKTRAPGLEREESAMLKAGVTTKSYGGSVIPEAVKKVLNEAIKNGATRYDVLESDTKPERDEHDATQWTLSGVWSPYGVQDSVPASGPMAFSYTEITPEKLEKDMTTEREVKVMTGTKHMSEVDRRSGKKVEWDEPQYETKKMKGTGNVTEHYDELGHSEVYALMPASEGYCKWDANACLLADGSLHALPAMRRSDDPQFEGLILTDPSLARDKRMVCNFHLGMKDGVITYVGIAGRMQKRVADGDAKLVNPLDVLKAGNFKIAPGLQLTFEGSGSVKIDNGLIVKG